MEFQELVYHKSMLTAKQYTASTPVLKSHFIEARSVLEKHINDSLVSIPLQAGKLSASVQY